MNYLYVGGFGVLGVLARYWMGTVMVSPEGGLPLAVLCVNVLGCMLGGFLLGVPGLDVKLSPPLFAAVTVGFLGGFTTFSAFGMDTLRLWESGAATMALLNVFLNNFLGIFACFLGYKIGILASKIF